MGKYIGLQFNEEKGTFESNGLTIDISSLAWKTDESTDIVIRGKDCEVALVSNGMLRGFRWECKEDGKKFDGTFNFPRKWDGIPSNPIELVEAFSQIIPAALYGPFLPMMGPFMPEKEDITHIPPSKKK